MWLLISGYTLTKYNPANNQVVLNVEMNCDKLFENPMFESNEVVVRTPDLWPENSASHIVYM